MNKNVKRILKLAILIFIVGGIGTRLCFLIVEGDKDPEIYEQITGENSVIPINYHYIKERSLWNQTLDIVTQDKELTTYSVYEDIFIEQINKLIEQDVYFATLEEVNEFIRREEFPEKCVWISFDDAEISVYEKAFPILKEKGVPFTIFIIGGQVGNYDFNNLEICTWNQLREMRDSGLVSFGSHTYNMHYQENNKPVFNYKNNYEDFYLDIVKSKEVIKKELGITIDSIAYPYGDTCDDLTEIVKRAGFKNAYILSPHVINAESDQYNLNRYLVNRKNFKAIGLENIGAGN